MRKFQDGSYFVENQRVREAELERSAERYAAEHDSLPRTQRFAWIRGLFTRQRPASGPPSRTRRR